MAHSFAQPGSRSGITRRFTLGSGVVLVAFGAAGYLLLGSSEERRILSLLRDLMAAASSLPRESDAERARRLHGCLLRSTLESVTLTLPELGTLEGRDEIMAAYARADGASLRFSIEQSDVRVRGARAAATLLSSLVVKVPGEERRQLRTVSVQLERTERHFLIVSIAVSAIVEQPPEARP